MKITKTIDDFADGFVEDKLITGTHDGREFKGNGERYWYTESGNYMEFESPAWVAADFAYRHESIDAARAALIVEIEKYAGYALIDESGRAYCNEQVMFYALALAALRSFE